MLHASHRSTYTCMCNVRCTAWFHLGLLVPLVYHLIDAVDQSLPPVHVRSVGTFWPLDSICLIQWSRLSA